MRRAHRAVNGIMDRFSLQSWGVMLVKRLVSWAGHVARMARRDAERWAGLVYTYRNRSYLLRVAAANNGCQLRCRKFRVWRWEEQVYRFGEARGMVWDGVCQCREQWSELLDDIAVWTVRNRRNDARDTG